MLSVRPINTVYDSRRIRSWIRVTLTDLPKEQAGPLARYVATIQSQRGDYNGRVLSVRHEDLRSLAVIYDKSPADLTEELISWGVLDADARGATEGF